MQVTKVPHGQCSCVQWAWQGALCGAHGEGGGLGPSMNLQSVCMPGGREGSFQQGPLSHLHPELLVQAV